LYRLAHAGLHLSDLSHLKLKLLFQIEVVAHGLNYTHQGKIPSDREDLVKLLARERLLDSPCPGYLSSCTGWLKDCLEINQQCVREPDGQDILPTRVIDIGDDLRNPSLHITSDHQVGPWTALSYFLGRWFDLHADGRIP